MVKLDQDEWIVDRRYNEFDRLNSDIKKANPDIKLHFPGKKLFGDNFDKDFIEKRMLKLNLFLNSVLQYSPILKMYFLKSRVFINNFFVLIDYRKCLYDFLEIRNFNSKKPVSNSEQDDFVLLGGTNNPAARPSDFDFLKVIGRGSFGKVYMANHKHENKIYAIKVLDKEAILKRNEVKHIMAERNVLITNLNHPFLIGLHYSFQSADKLYFVLDYVNGGELFYHLSNKRVFKEPRVKFYSAEIAHAIGYMHSKNIIYRDLKPENILIDADVNLIS